MGRSRTARIAVSALGAVILLASACGTANTSSASTDAGWPWPQLRSPHAVDVSTTTTSTTAVPATNAPATNPPTTAAPPCAPGIAGQLTSTAGADQLIVVQAPTYSTTYATLTAWQRRGSCWVTAFGPWTARIGANGFSDDKHEGDETTPTGAYGIGPVMYGNAADPGVHYQFHPLVCGDWWDEDPSSATYNTFQFVPCGQAPPFGGDSEALWEETTAYPIFAVIDYNIDPIVPDAGSAIFIHADVGGPTAGCVSLPLGELDQLLVWLQPTETPLVVMGPDSEITRF